MGPGTDVFADLAGEGAELDGVLAGLSAEQWQLPTSAPGWSIADQVGHLTATDELAVQAARDPEGFRAVRGELVAMLEGGLEPASQYRPSESGVALHERWRTAQSAVLDALHGHPPGTRMPWFGPDMSPAGIATGRLMELWAHGGDIADALGMVRPPTGRIRHIARLGVGARDHAFAVHGLPAPSDPFRVELVGPDGDVWHFGPADAPQAVTGPAIDFCLLATRRVHRNDTALRASGPDADRWLDVAQAFVGAPGEGRPPRA